jgi:ankyrin repeat protein
MGNRKRKSGSETHFNMKGLVGSLLKCVSGPHCSVLLLIMGSASAGTAWAQIPPSSTEVGAYTGLLAAAAGGDLAALETGLNNGANPDVRDAYGRTPLHVAAYTGQHEVMRLLVAAGADPNALESDRYDIVTIAAVANDVPTLEVALALGAKTTNVTSPYDGTALIAAAHLGHVEVVGILVGAGAPLDHVNNLGWTALIESIVLGDGGPRHTETLKLLVDGGANVDLADSNGRSPRALAQSRGFAEMVRILEAAGAH